MKSDVNPIIRVSLLYCILSASFSILGIFLAQKGATVTPIPPSAYTVQEIAGHIIWGLIAGAASLSLRYFILSGSFAIFIDSDHLIQLIPVATVIRMSHSISFGIISLVIMMLLFGKKDYLLGATVIGGLLAHLSYDTFNGKDGVFPIFTPFYNHMIIFPNIDWIFLEIAAVAVIGSVALLTTRTKNSLKSKA